MALNDIAVEWSNINLLMIFIKSYFSLIPTNKAWFLLYLIIKVQNIQGRLDLIILGNIVWSNHLIQENELLVG